jgi:hypothetical protein
MYVKHRCSRSPAQIFLRVEYINIFLSENLKGIYTYVYYTSAVGRFAFFFAPSTRVQREQNIFVNFKVAAIT